MISDSALLSAHPRRYTDEPRFASRRRVFGNRAVVVDHILVGELALWVTTVDKMCAIGPRARCSMPQMAIFHDQSLVCVLQVARRSPTLDAVPVGKAHCIYSEPSCAWCRFLVYDAAQIWFL